RSALPANPAQVFLCDDLRKCGHDWFLRLPSGCPLGSNCHLRVVRCARSWGTCNSRKRLGPQGLADRWGHCDGFWHLVDALHRNAGLSLTCVGELLLADRSAVAFGGYLCLGFRVVCSEPARTGHGSVVMGAAVSAMHYTGMASASFMPSTVAPGLSHAASVSSLGNAGIVIVTLIVLVTVVLTSAVDRRLASQRAELERGRELATINEELRKEMLERQRAEDALRRSEDQLRLVIDTIPALVWSASPDGSLDFLNQRWL